MPTSTKPLNTKRLIVASSLITTFLVVFISINADRHIKQMSQNNTELYNAFRISELMKSFRSNLIQMENKQKGYLASGNARFLEDYKLEETETKSYLKSMEKYFSGKPEEELFYVLKELTYKRIIEGKDLEKSESLEGYKNKINRFEDPHLQTMNEIHKVIDKINSSLNLSTEQLIERSVEYVRVSKVWSFLEVAVGILAALGAVIVLFRDVNLRTKLENELRIAKKQAEDNALLKEQFMANVSHEIRTPMNSILGFSDLLTKTPLDKTQSEYLTAIRTSSSNLLNIINDILDFSKIEAGKLSIEKIPFNLTSLIDSLKIMFSQKARDKNIQLNVYLDKLIPQHLFGDPTRLTQVLVNLINNAIKFTEKGEVTLSCEIKTIEHDVAQLVFRVKDTGIGIPQDKINQIFDRFDQGNKETTRKYGGTGLGLSIVKSLLEIQNGDIYVKSKESIGSEFIVTISYPISYEDINFSTSESINLLPKLSNFEHHILLAEDNVLNQKLAAGYLGNFGLKLDIAENGLEAIEKLKLKKYDLILMDIQMPIIDGYNATAIIRKELLLTIPIVAMTAHIMTGEKEKCMKFGMNDYITKPFKEAELYQILKKLLFIENSNSFSRKINHVTVNTTSQIVTVDMNELHQLSRGNNEFIKEMIDLFSEQNPIDINKLDKALEQEDFESIKSTAHRMKTSVGFMGIKSALEPLNKLEDLSEKKQNIEEISTLVATIKNICSKAQQEFQLISPNLNPS
jgi:signal transduction histidine kinase/DNA-binding NarL/FixJ family response regulator